MKKLCLGICVALLSPLAFGQNCAAPGGPLQSGGPGTTGNSCGGSNEFSSVCGGSILAGGLSRTYLVNIGAANNFTVTVTPDSSAAGLLYDPAIFFVGPNACSAVASCAPNGDADNAGQGAAETFSFNGLTPGAWYMVVSSTNLADAGASCGPFAINITGTLPVELKTFSVE